MNYKQARVRVTVCIVVYGMTLLGPKGPVNLHSFTSIEEWNVTILEDNRSNKIIFCYKRVSLFIQMDS